MIARARTRYALRPVKRMLRKAWRAAIFSCRGPDAQRSCATDRRGVPRLGSPSLAPGVGNDPDPVSLVRRTNGGSRYAVPLRIIPERGQVSENDAKLSPKQCCDVLHNDVSRQKFANKSSAAPGAELPDAVSSAMPSAGPLCRPGGAHAEPVPPRPACALPLLHPCPHRVAASAGVLVVLVVVVVLAQRRVAESVVHVPWGSRPSPACRAPRCRTRARAPAVTRNLL